MRVTVVMAWPDRCDCIELQLDPGATVVDAVSASRFALDGISGFAVFGMRVEATSPLCDGDRVELLRPLPHTPLETRRLRAERHASRTNRKEKTRTG